MIYTYREDDIKTLTEWQDADSIGCFGVVTRLELVAEFLHVDKRVLFEYLDSIYSALTYLQTKPVRKVELGFSDYEEYDWRKGIPCTVPMGTTYLLKKEGLLLLAPALIGNRDALDMLDDAHTALYMAELGPEAVHRKDVCVMGGQDAEEVKPDESCEQAVPPDEVVGDYKDLSTEYEALQEHCDYLRTHARGLHAEQMDAEMERDRMLDQLTKLKRKNKKLKATLKAHIDEMTAAI